MRMWCMDRMRKAKDPWIGAEMMMIVINAIVYYLCKVKIKKACCSSLNVCFYHPKQFFHSILQFGRNFLNRIQFGRKFLNRMQLDRKYSKLECNNFNPNYLLLRQVNAMNSSSIENYITGCKSIEIFWTKFTLADSL